MSQWERQVEKRRGASEVSGEKVTDAIARSSQLISRVIKYPTPSHEPSLSPSDWANANAPGAWGCSLSLSTLHAPHGRSETGGRGGAWLYGGSAFLRGPFGASVRFTVLWAPSGPEERGGTASQFHTSLASPPPLSVSSVCISFNYIALHNLHLAGALIQSNLRYQRTQLHLSSPGTMCLTNLTLI